MQFQWIGANGDAWDIVADWDYHGGAAAGIIPDGSDVVSLIAGHGPLISGDGTANAIHADAPYTLSGAITLLVVTGPKLDAARRLLAEAAGLGAYQVERRAS